MQFPFAVDRERERGRIHANLGGVEQVDAIRALLEANRIAGHRVLQAAIEGAGGNAAGPFGPGLVDGGEEILTPHAGLRGYEDDRRVLEELDPIGEFLAHLGREIPELRLTLPPTAIGKDYLPDGRIFARTPSGTGYQASIAGLLGLIAGGDEGFELNVLGLVTGFDLARPALKLPGIGRVPADD